ncbi:MAG: hypothetical protein DLM53_04800 [Candidatus Eremiobacter antarcticus]|nr:hypothetical protein [Candidatus Eremiobacteraeota bacterium]MBC5807898.1 hypothetical protein [Candidatus Eremiobacteraeota bacterium]PZR62732.1 MAG: hypothetical protein DLM53_04800 [Candidatus Eremiobacter sp. RRmetagenome_bin22]
MKSSAAVAIVALLLAFGSLYLRGVELAHAGLDSVSRNDAEDHSGTLGPYYVDDGGHPEHRARGVTMHDEVPMVDYGRGGQLNPVLVEQYALELFHRYARSHSAEDKRLFLVQADWLRRFCRQGRCEYEFPFPPQISSARWVSSLGQAQEISVQLRAYQLTGDTKFLAAANAAYRVLVTPFPRGPMMLSGEEAWFEEYPQTPATHVLNGHMFALLSLWEYYRVTHDPSARNWFLRGIAALKSGIQQSDTGFWARYDLLHAQLCSRKYLNIEIAQLITLSGIANDEFLAEIAQRFEAYKTNPILSLRVRWYALHHPHALSEVVSD